MATTKPCPICFGLGKEAHWEQRADHMIRVLSHPWIDCRACGGTGVELPYDGDAIPSERALVVWEG